MEFDAQTAPPGHGKPVQELEEFWLARAAFLVVVR
jgi:hypothetical protein